MRWNGNVAALHRVGQKEKELTREKSENLRIRGLDRASRKSLREL
jgi:hypothetical protein